MSNDFEQSTLSQALADARSVYAVVASMPGQPYANHFRQLVSSLETGNFEEAVRIRSALPFAGMGGFGEFFESTPAIQKP
jgi:hypothetical protein